MSSDKDSQTSRRRWWHHPVSFNARLRIAGALTVSGLIAGVVQFVGVDIVGLVALMFGVILNPVLVLLLLLEFGTSCAAARSGSPSYLRGGMLGTFAGLALSALALFYLSTWVSPHDPFGAAAIWWFALPIVASTVGGSALVGTIVGSRSGNAVPIDVSRHAAPVLTMPVADAIPPRRGLGLSAFDLLVPFSLLAFGMSFIYLDVDIDSLTPYLILVPALCLMVLVCVYATRPRASIQKRGGLIGAGVGSVFACITVVQMVDSSDPFASGFSYIVAPPLIAFLVGGGALLGIVVGLGIQLAKGK